MFTLVHYLRDAKGDVPMRQFRVLTKQRVCGVQLVHFAESKQTPVYTSNSAMADVTAASGHWVAVEKEPAVCSACTWVAEGV